ncbi:MAG: LysR family transcriptional regulator [Bdellovibrionia bacterium]
MELELVHIFVYVIKYGSFTKAAAQLKLPKSTVSKAITRLEKETGTKLIVRTTRHQTLTPAGRAFYETCASPIEVLETAHKSLHGNESLIAGTIKLTAPEDLGSKIIAPAIAALSQNYPNLFFDLNYTDKLLDLIADGIDLAIRIGHLKESSLKAKKVGDLKLILVASPKYLNKKPKITKISDLRSHDCLALSSYSSTNSWRLKHKTKSEQITIRPRIISNQMSSLLSATLAGGGITLIPAFLCQSHIDSHELIQILPQWTSANLPVSLLSPLNFSSSARLRTIADHLANEIQKALK